MTVANKINSKIETIRCLLCKINNSTKGIYNLKICKTSKIIFKKISSVITDSYKQTADTKICILYILIMFLHMYAIHFNIHNHDS